MTPFDPNVTPVRADLAAEHLRGVVDAPRYATAAAARARLGTVAVRDATDANRPQVTELLYGEDFRAYDRRDGWAWGQCAHDDYVGYVEEAELDWEPKTPTHQVVALRALLFPHADFKTPCAGALSLGSRLTVVDRSDGPGGGYLRLDSGGWISEKSASALAEGGHGRPDPVDVALRFLGVPYLWGGRSSLGLDCSGLVQIALAQAGVPAPRDAYMQEAALGTPVDQASGDPLRRGDLVFFPGHVGIMADDRTLLHANITAMAVTLDPLADIAARVEAAEGRGITAVRRLEVISPEG